MRLFCILLVLLAMPALADQIPAELQKMENSGQATVVRNFPGPQGLTGWIIKMNTRYLVVYSLPGGQYILSGALVGPHGENLTKTYLEQYVPKPDFDTVVTSLRKDLNLVTEGSSNAPEIFVYVDPNCIYCNSFWNSLRPYINTGKVRVHWIMVDFLKSSSPGRAAAILAAGDRVAALRLDETRFDKTHEEGGIPAITPVPADVKAMLSAHGQQLRDIGGNGTPTILLQEQGKWTAYYGTPGNVAAFMEIIAVGQPGAGTGQARH